MRLVNPAEIRRRLNTERVWAAYALGDLEPGFAEQCEWHGVEPSDALILIYRGAQPPVIFALGQPDEVRGVLAEIDEPQLYLLVQPEMVSLIAERWQVTNIELMWRMALTHPLASAPSSEVSRLTDRDWPEVQQLHRIARDAGDGMDFFNEFIFRQGVYYGVYDGDRLIAIAGTHLVSQSESVAAIGNVYTHPNWRGRGLAPQTTSAVVAELLRRNIDTIALNVSQHNPAAERVYHQLGFERVCAFVEGIGRVIGH